MERVPFEMTKDSTAIEILFCEEFKKQAKKSPPEKITFSAVHSTAVQRVFIFCDRI